MHTDIKLRFGHWRRPAFGVSGASGPLACMPPLGNGAGKPRRRRPSPGGVALTLCLLAWGTGWLALVTAAGTASADPSLRGVLAVRGDSTVAAENTAQRFVPASVLKLVVTAAALHYLGPEYRCVSEVAGTGPLAKGTLTGDLVLLGGGDPTWSARYQAKGARDPLQRLVRQLKRKGLRRVTGDLVVDASRFPGPAQPLSRPQAERALAYGAPTSAVALDENTFALQIGPGKRAGQPGWLSVKNKFLRLENRILTVGREHRGRGTVGFYPGLDGRTLLVHGEYPIGEPSYRVRASLPDPHLYVGSVLRDLLGTEGIRLDGEVKVSAVPVKTHGEAALAQFQSAPLKRWLSPILSDSQNWYAEMLLRILALQADGLGRLDRGLELESRFLEREAEIPPHAFFLDDASGLSPYNLLTPEAVVKLLGYVLQQPWRDAFLDAMAQTGKGTLRRWPKGLDLRAKTGTIQHTLSLAGYLRPDSEEPVIFAVFLTHWSGRRSAARAEVRRLVKHWQECTETPKVACASRVTRSAPKAASG